MREIAFGKVVEAVEGLCEASCHELPEDVLAALEEAARRERDAGAVKILNQLIENARIARDERIPLCQDTGLAVIFVEQGSDVVFKSAGGKTIFDALNEGVAGGYEKGYLRKSAVEDPLGERINTKTNTPAIIHYSIAAGDKLKVSLMTKGGGCENKSQFKMFKPTAGKEEVIDWVVEVVRTAGADACPPFVVGVGIGGNFEYSCYLSKRALLRDIREKNTDGFYAQIEEEILSKVNGLGLGPMGLGGDTTALACVIETAACHIASLPIAVNIECHSHRHKTAII